jgi:1-acyl-sn-glycerol-3-phosphate acyltransferase
LIYVILSLLVWFYFAVSSLIFFPIALVIFLFTALFDKQRRLLHKFTNFWASTYVWVNPLWNIEFEAKEKLQKDQTFVYVSNHQSLLDVILVHNLFVHFKWVAKDSLFKIPFVGWNLSLNDYVRLSRKDPKSHFKFLNQGGKHLDRGSSLFIFPEGTRSLDGEIHEFKDGAFLLAKKARVGVQPIVIDGAFQAVPKKGFIMNKIQTIKIRILDPIPAQELGKIKVKAIAPLVRERMTKALGEMRS